jgi:type VI secretion system secreted protein Hcp
MKDIFLHIEGVKGESADDAHKDDIDVLSWEWGMTQSGTTHKGTGGGAGKVQVRDLAIIKYVDKATPNLVKACCNGKHFSKALLTVRKAGEQPLEYLKIKMEKVLITAVDSGTGVEANGSDEDDRLREKVSLNFAKMEVEYTPQKEDGSGDAAVTIGWDIAANKEA